ncbi:MAG: MaoC family dehydratase [Gemmatimonadota bacterium]
MSAPDATPDAAPAHDRFAEFFVGQWAELSKYVSDADVMQFADVTGDRNPVHVDPVAAAASRFGERIAHGMLAAGYISAVMAMKLPGPGAIYVSQSLRFVRPVRIGDTITARAEVVEVFATRRRLRLSTLCRNQQGEVVVDGEAVILVPA